MKIKSMRCRWFGHKWETNKVGNLLYKIDKMGTLVTIVEEKSFPFRICSRCGVKEVALPKTFMEWGKPNEY